MLDGTKGINMKEPTNNDRELPLEPTAGPYEIRVRPSDFDPEIYSSTTRQPVAHIYTRSFDQRNAPIDQVALSNAALLSAAPQMRDSLRELLQGEERLRPTTANGIRALLERIDAGTPKSFVQDRTRKRQAFEASIKEQVNEMSRQSGSKPFRLNEGPETEGTRCELEMEDQDEHGHAF